MRLPVSDDLAKFCDRFVNLQEQRHRADYDTGQRFTRVDAATSVEQANLAHATWRGERDTHNARVFLLASARLLGTR